MKTFFTSILFRLFVLFFISYAETGIAQDSIPPLRGTPEEQTGIENFPGAWNLPNTDLYLKFGGYFKLDAIYDWTGAGTRNQLLISQIPVEGSQEATAGPFYNMHLRETRFHFDLRTKTKLGRPLKFFLEFDFFDESLSPGQPRLRHAFVKYGNLLVGQTWTNLSDLRIFPFIIDFAFGDALFGGRSTQVRWEQDISKHFNYGVALEMPGMGGVADPFDLGGEATPALPLLSARITNEHKGGIIMLGAQAEQIRWDGRDVGPNVTEIGWGAILNGRQSISKRIFTTWHASYSSGITDQIIVFGGTDQGAVLDSNGQMIKENAITLALGLGYQFIDRMSLNLAYAFVDRDELKFRPDETIKDGGIGHVNIIWDVDSKTKAGIEYMYGHRKNIAGAEGEAGRVQAMIRYVF